MLPIQFLFLTVLPVIDMRLQCKSQGIGYPSGVPTDVSKVLELDIVSILENYIITSLIESSFPLNLMQKTNYYSADQMGASGAG